MTKKIETKSPLKDPPLRYCGQSIDEEIDRTFTDEALIYVLIVVGAPVFAVMEWWRWWRKIPPGPLGLTLLTFIVVPFCTIKLIRIRKKIIRLKLGRDGERAVGQYLELLREKGCRVYHDIVGKDFNLDHVVLSEQGIFVIETKTFSKPKRGEPKILFDGKKVLVNNHEPDRNPVIQVKAGAGWLKELLFETTGKKFPIRPVILFPGWFIEPTKEGKASNTWVLNPKALPSFIENSPALMSKEDMMLASYHLSRYIRIS